MPMEEQTHPYTGVFGAETHPYTGVFPIETLPKELQILINNLNKRSSKKELTVGHSKTLRMATINCSTISRAPEKQR